MKKKVILILSCLLLSVGFITAQTTRISGIVVDNAGEPVISASVVVKGTTIGTITDLDGKFTIGVPDGRNTLVFTLIGMKASEVRVSQNMRVVMSTDEALLDEVVIQVPYGTVKKESFTGSAAVITSDKIEKRVVANVTKALDGLATGVITTSGGGQPGGAASVRVRGYGSINANQDPLYVIDGTPFDGSLSALNPNDIETMTVLKDAAATALYGSRGGNGVIMITTKRGKAGGVNVNLKANWGWSSRGIGSYDFVNQEEYVQLTYEALRNKNVYGSGQSWAAAGAAARNSLSTTLGGEKYNPFKNYTWADIIDPTTEQIRPDAKSVWNENWMDAITRKGAPRQEYQISITGGNDKTQTLASFSYLNEDGVLETTSFERFSGRINVDNQATHWFKSGLSSAFSMSKSNFSTYEGTSNANPWYTAQFIGPIYPVYLKDINGNNVLNEAGNLQFDMGDGRPKLSDFNSLATLYDDKFNTKNDNLSARAYAELGSDNARVGALQGLKLILNLGVDYRTQNQLTYYNMYHGNFSSQGGLMYKYNTRTFSYTFNQLLSYNRKFGDHSFDAKVGHEIYAMDYNYLWAAKSGLIDGYYELDAAVNDKGNGSYLDTDRIESYLSYLNYNYQDKYYLSGSVRRDGSSKFHKDNRWGTFWSLGANWRVTQEKFLADVSWLNNLAIKMSYGEQGNSNLPSDLGGYYAWQSLYDFGYPNNNNAGAIISSLENKDVSWEKSGNLNAGFDVRLFNRLNISFEYYNKKTKDLLLRKPMAPSTGFEGYWANIGDMTNQGMEFSIGGSIVNKPNFKWEATFMGSTVSNKVDKLTENATRLTYGTQVIEVGKEIYTFRMPKAAGVDPANGSQLYWIYDTDADGNMINERISADKTKAATSLYYHGSRIPDLYGSFNMNFTFFKNFDLSILTAYSIGGKIYDSLYRSSMEAQYAGDTWHKNALRRWQSPGDITDIPRVTMNSGNLATNKDLIDASYFAIKNISAGYSLPKSLVQKVNLKSLRIFCTLDNLVTFTHLEGMDPQHDFRGFTDWSYVPNKTISVGLDINF